VSKSERDLLAAAEHAEKFLVAVFDEPIDGNHVLVQRESVEKLLGELRKAIAGARQ
jgi:hypothetical protein